MKKRPHFQAVSRFIIYKVAFQDIIARTTLIMVLTFSCHAINKFNAHLYEYRVWNIRATRLLCLGIVLPSLQIHL